MRVLLSGDLHIGRRSSRLPTDTDPRETASAAAWHALVQAALDNRAHVLALSGDVVDKTNGFYEAYGVLERGLRRLREADIAVVAVCGNHDYAALAQLAAALPEGLLTLIGTGSQWERHTIERDGERLHVDGWSFSTPHFDRSPVASYSLPPSPDTPTIGLLHADLNQKGSSYAPVMLPELTALPPSLWCLGHVHCSVQHATLGAPLVMYPGSPNPMDPGEPGEHGTWLVELANGKPVEPQLIPLARVRYEQLQVDISHVQSLAELREFLPLHVRQLAEPMCTPPLRYLSLRVELTGRTGAYRELAAESAELWQDLEMDVGDVRVLVDRVRNSARPKRDLTSLVTGSEAPSWAARLLVALESEAGEVPAEFAGLLAEVSSLPQAFRGHRMYSQLSPSTADDTASLVNAELTRQAGLLLDELLTQKDDAA